MRRARLHRATFTAAGIYNIAWAIGSVARPQWLFDAAGMPPANYPEIFVCLAMVIGLYGVLYFGVARNLEHGELVAAVGLAGKVLGPLGWIALVGTGRWPLETIALILTNDLVWWLPFAMYLSDVRGVGGTMAG